MPFRPPLASASLSAVVASVMTFGTWEAVARAKQLASEDPARLRAIALALAVHVTVALSVVFAVRIAERRFHRRLSWPWGTLASIPVFLVLALEIVHHVQSGEGGLRALSWFIGMVVGLPVALLAAWLTSWWMVGVAGVKCSTWCTLMAVLYLPLIVSHGLSHW